MVPRHSDSFEKKETLKKKPASEKGGALLECLLILARTHSVITTAETLLAGLPLQDHLLTPSLFARAAKRACAGAAFPSSHLPTSRHPLAG